MKMTWYAVAPMVAGLLGGCASIQPVVSTSLAPDPMSGYVAGMFTRVSSGGFAFIVRNLDSGEEYGVPLGEDSFLPKDVKDQVISIKVPPGRYAVTEWVTYGTGMKERTSKTAVSNPYLAAPFVVERGTVVYLGRYSASTTHSFTYRSETRWTVKPDPVRSDEAHKSFVKAYPLFSASPFKCHMCVDTVQGIERARSN